MGYWPTDRSTLNRTLSDEVWAIIYKKTDQKPAPAAAITFPKLTYSDAVCCQVSRPVGTPDPTTTSFQVDVSEGASTTYGAISGAIDGVNTQYVTSKPYIPGSLRLWWNQVELDPGAANDFQESIPELATFVLNAAIPTGKLLAAYNTLPGTEERQIAQSEGVNKTVGTITGAINGANTTYTLPGGFKSGKLVVFWNGGVLYEGTDQDYVETDPEAGTFDMLVAIPNGVLKAWWIPYSDTGWITDRSSDSTLSGALDGSNTTYVTRYPYEPGSLTVRYNGAEQMEGDAEDFVITDPGAGSFNLTWAPAVGKLAVTYRTGNASDTTPGTNLTTKVAAYTLTAADSTVLGNGTFALTLPPAVIGSGKLYHVKNIGTGTLTLDPDGAETIDGNASIELTRYDCAQIVSDGTEWWII